MPLACSQFCPWTESGILLHVLCRFSKLIIMAMLVRRFVMFNNCNREASGRESSDGVCRTWLLYLTCYQHDDDTCAQSASGYLLSACWVHRYWDSYWATVVGSKSVSLPSQCTEVRHQMDSGANVWRIWLWRRSCALEVPVSVLACFLH